MLFLYNKEELRDYFSFIHSVKEAVEKPFFTSSQVKGWCDFCGTISLMKNEISQDDQWINRRGQFICNSCGLSARLRSFYSALKAYTKPGFNCIIYEKASLFYHRLSSKYNYYLGTEYFEDYSLGQEVKHNNLLIRNEDIMSTTFCDNTFDLVAHQEVLEHVPEPELALQDNFRILKDGGHLIFTTPFYHHLAKTIVNATVDNGKVIHLQKPIYHGNPLSEEGALVFQLFGQSFLDIFFDIGFSKAWVGFDFDISRCIFSCGNPYPVGQMHPVIFFGKK